MVFVVDDHLKVMELLPGEDLERWLVRLVGNAEPHHRSNNHLRATREVIHHVFKFGLQSDLVNEVEVDSRLSGDLEPHIAFNEEDLAANLREHIILFPLSRFFIYPEEQDTPARPDDECLFIH